MPVREVQADSDIAELTDRLAEAHPTLLAPHVVSQEQLQRLVAKLIAHEKRRQQQTEEASDLVRLVWQESAVH